MAKLVLFSIYIRQCPMTKLKSTFRWTRCCLYDTCLTNKISLMGDKRPVRHLQSTFQRREMKFVSLWHQNRANGKLQCFFPLSKTVSWQIQNRVKYFTLETGENNNGNVFLKTFCNLTTYSHPASVIDTVNKLVFHVQPVCPVFVRPWS